MSDFRGSPIAPRGTICLKISISQLTQLGVCQHPHNADIENLNCRNPTIGQRNLLIHPLHTLGQVIQKASHSSYIIEHFGTTVDVHASRLRCLVASGALPVKPADHNMFEVVMPLYSNLMSIVLFFDQASSLRLVFCFIGPLSQVAVIL